MRTFVNVKRRNIFILTMLSAIGLTGLTIVQIIWLKNAIAVKEQRFDNTVKESLYEIANSVQEYEYQPFVRDLIARNADAIADGNTPEARFLSMIEQMSGTQKIYVHIDDYLDTTISIEPAKMQKSVRSENERQEMEDIKTWSFDFDISDLPVSVMVDPNEFAEKFIAQRKALNELVLKQMFSLQPITEVLDTARLRDIIGKTLKGKGINTEFEFGITEYTNNNFVYVSTASSLKDLYESKYVIDLFPRSMFESAKYLMLIFPDRNKYIMNTLWVPAGFTVLFLILVLLSFGLAIYIIFRQKQLSEMKTEFINNMTHELKTPISTISLASQMLRDDSISSNQSSRLKYAGVIYDENKRLGNQFEKVLQMARMEKGEIKYNKTPIDVHDLIAVVLHQFSLQMDDAHGVLNHEFNANQSIIIGDEMHITNMMNNLLDNALKYNDKDEPLISVRTENSPGYLVIRVRDNGMGIKKDELKKIFDKFYRVNKGDVHNTKGFGIGLSYVKSIVEAHEGTISVQSQLGVGTVFTVRFPLKTD